MKRPRLLVTGFGPFPGMPDNPTAEIVAFLERGARRWGDAAPADGVGRLR